jgi:hypothetical protein
MDQVLLFVLVTMGWILITSIIGILMDRSVKSIGVWKPVVHVLIFLFVTGGVLSSLAGVFQINPLRIWSLITLIISAIAVLCNLIVGIIMLLLKKKNKSFVNVHLSSTIILASAIISTAVLSILNM